MFTVDAHLDLSMNAMEWNRDLRIPAAELNARERARGLTDKPDRGNAVVSFPDLRRGHVGLVVATQIARYVAPDNPLPGWASPEQAWSQTQAQVQWYRTMEEAGEMVHVVDRAGLDAHVARWLAVIAAGGDTSQLPIGYILSLEGADSLITPAYLGRAHRYGLRAVGPAHYGPGRYAHGTEASASLNAAGLNSIFVQPTWSLDPLFLPVPEIVRLLAFAPAEAPLSFLEPSRVRQASPLGTSWIWQADHNVRGGPLDLAGPPISWGCGVHARTELTWPLTKGVREFRCRVGLDRIVAGGGCVRASIHANDAAGPPLWQSEILVGSGSAADCGSLPLAGPDGGQNDLVLVADDAHRDRPPGADPFDIRDCVDWAEPLVLFDPTAVPVRTAARLAFMVPAWTGWTVAADPPGRVRLLSLIDPVLGYHRAGWATVSVAEGGPLRLTRTWQSLRPQDRTLVIAVSGHGPATGPLMLRIDGWEWELVPPGRDGETAVPFVLPLEGRPDGPLTVEIVAPVGQQVQWHGLGLAGPLDEGWFPLEAVQVESSGGTTFQRREDGAILASMPAPNEDAYTIQLKSSHGSIRALRMDALLDPTLTPPHLGPGRGHNHGLFDVTGLTVSVGDPDAAGASLEAVAGYSHPRHPPGFGPLAPVQRIPVPNSYPHWGGAQGMPNVAVLHFREDQPAPEELGVKLEFNNGPMSLGCFRFYGSADPGARLPVMAVTTLVREPAPAGAPPKPIVVGKPVEPPPGP